MVRLYHKVALLAIGVLALAGLAAGAGEPSVSSATGELLLPDLQALPPRDIEIVQVRVKGKIEKRLRFDTRIANLGSGPLELYPVSEPCGLDPSNHLAAYQRVFADTGGGSGFQRGSDSSTPQFVGCMIFHPKHHHWHVEGFATYELYRGTAKVASSDKVSFCMLDMEWEGTGPAPTPYYGACGRNATMGISVNWADEYYSTLADQYIVINDVPNVDGDYCLVNIANVAALNPTDVKPGLREYPTTNNRSGVKITISSNGTAVSPRFNPNEPAASDLCSAP